MNPSAPSYTVTEVAKFAKVSVRTLHFYDEIGLLPPAFCGANGYRYYQLPQLQRLQDILFFRELGFGLEQIQTLIDAPNYDRVEALRSHLDKLQAQAVRVGELIATIKTTIHAIEDKLPMNPENMYQGVSPEKQAEFEAYLVNRFGACTTTHLATSKERTRNWKKSDYEKARQDCDTISQSFAAVLQRGAKPSDPEVQRLVRQHHEYVSQFWVPDRDAYIGLSQMYVEHPEFREYYTKFDPRLPEFLAAAIRAFAERELSKAS